MLSRSVSLTSPPPVLSEDDIGLAIGPLFLLSCPTPWLDKIKLSVLFRYCSCAAVGATDVACSERSAVESSPEPTEGKMVLTIRPAGLLLPVDTGATGLAELMAGDDEGESFQLEPLP